MKKTENKKLSFVIPCYGSEKTISFVINEIVSTVKDKNPYEIICVNDCSPDNLYETLEKIAIENKNIKVINLARNFGQHNALMAGFRFVTGDTIICLDDDGQTDPNDCYKLIEALSDDVDVAYARYPKKKENIFRLVGSRFANRTKHWLCDIPQNIETNSYFACKRFIVEEIIRYDNAYTYLAGLVIRTTKKIVNVDIPHHKRIEGKSGYSIKKLFSLWLNNFTSFSVKPLRIATICGMICALGGLVFSVYIIIKKIMVPEIQVGYSSIMCVLLFIGGMLMLMLGLIGEYIGRIYICLNKAPQYVIRNTINIENEK